MVVSADVYEGLVTITAVMDRRLLVDFVVAVAGLDRDTVRVSSEATLRAAVRVLICNYTTGGRSQVRALLEDISIFGEEEMVRRSPLLAVFL